MRDMNKSLRNNRAGFQRTPLRESCRGANENTLMAPVHETVIPAKNPAFRTVNE